MWGGVTGSHGLASLTSPLSLGPASVPVKGEGKVLFPLRCDREMDGLISVTKKPKGRA